jgi:hypothetical protein
VLLPLVSCNFFHHINHPAAQSRIFALMVVKTLVNASPSELDRTLET